MGPLLYSNEAMSLLLILLHPPKHRNLPLSSADKPASVTSPHKTTIKEANLMVLMAQIKGETMEICT
jgi:hypothetical protein